MTYAALVIGIRLGIEAGTSGSASSTTSTSSDSAAKRPASAASVSTSGDCASRRICARRSVGLCGSTGKYACPLRNTPRIAAMSQGPRLMQIAIGGT